jgi:hypothetical protein
MAIVNHLNGATIPPVITAPATVDKTPNKAVHPPISQRIPVVKQGVYSFTEWV